MRVQAAKVDRSIVKILVLFRISRKINLSTSRNSVKIRCDSQGKRADFCDGPRGYWVINVCKNIREFAQCLIEFNWNVVGHWNCLLWVGVLVWVQLHFHSSQKFDTTLPPHKQTLNVSQSFLTVMMLYLLKLKVLQVLSDSLSYQPPFWIIPTLACCCYDAIHWFFPFYYTPVRVRAARASC